MSYNILTQKELTIDLSREAIMYVLACMGYMPRRPIPPQAECEIDNFRNTLLNLLERSETGNLDLVGG